jgi:hypothetical protein
MRAETRNVFREIGRLPRQVRKIAREVHRVLTRAAADLEHPATFADRVDQDLEDRILVAFRGRRERQLLHQAMP